MLSLFVRRSVLACALVAAGRLAAQGVQAPPLTVHGIWGSTEFASDLIDVVWTSDGTGYTAVEEDASGNTDLYRTDAITGVKRLLLRGADLVPPGAGRPVKIEEYHFSADGSKLLLFTNSTRVWRENTKGTFYVYFASKTELIAQLREAMIADYQTRMAKAITDSSPIGFSSGFSPEVVGVSIDFLSSDLHSVLFPSATDQAHGQREVVHGFEELLIDANRQGITNVPDPHWFAVLLVGAANFAVRYSLEARTFDRDALVAAIVELQRRALEL